MAPTCSAHKDCPLGLPTLITQKPLPPSPPLDQSVARSNAKQRHHKEKERSKPQKMDGKPKAGVSMTNTWLRNHRLIYSGATRHPFILSIRDGTVDLSAFKRWLGQDYIFVRAFVPFVASVLIKAWKNSDHESGDIELVLSGVAALNDEIEWFKQEASEWGVELSGVVPEKTTEDYCRWLSRRMK